MHAAQSFSRVNSSSASQKTTHFYRIRKFTKASHMSLTSARSIQSKHSHIQFKLYYDIILPSTLMSSKWFLSLRFPSQHPVCITPLHHTCHMPYSIHSSLLLYLNNILSWVKIIKFLIMRFPLITFYLFPLGPKFLYQHPSPWHPLPIFFPLRESRFHKANINRRKFDLKKKTHHIPTACLHFTLSQV